eukprot:TRINITY_DN2690_c0_g1_i1.p1 TRINITY_DN2690_c0_g1~~TRINITY_DN2690_c0_g1_i1.p1  ORF type:complete len:224 (-),score=51.31 TRINITY_DN2690_c0_g1_i1:100-771(-)
MAGACRMRRAVRWNILASLEKAYCNKDLGLLNPGLGLRTVKSSPKKISAVLTSHVDRLGKPGDIVQVKPGHFRNHLLPSVLALPNVPKYRDPLHQYLEMFPELVEEEKAEEEKEETKDASEAAAEAAAHLQEAQLVASRLDRGSIVFYRHVKEKEEIRLPVTAMDVVKEVRRQMNVQITEMNLKMPEAIRTLGEVEVPLVFPREVPLPNERTSVSLKVRVRRK